MYYLLTTRVVKTNTNAREKFAPRTTNTEFNSISGPFRKKITAERAAVAAMATHTCLSAQITTGEQLIAQYDRFTMTGHYGEAKSIEGLVRVVRELAAV